MAIKILNDLLPIAEQTEVGVVKPDNVSITITETGELQSSVVDLPEEVVTAENYDNPKLWKGTLEEYNAIETKNPLVTYIITDDNVETLKTTDYNVLSNKPSINDVTLEGNKTLEDLNIQAADTSLTTSQITNCITKIPQDIKLELVDGTLTLKAGSKVYVPNGAGVFDEFTIQNDFIHSYGTVHTAGLLLLNTTGNEINGIEVYPHSFIFSGTEQPSGNIYIWYNTTSNIIKTYLNGVAGGGTMSFPIAEFTGNSSQITSIKVFNGFGYIGSTIFALPGVKGLVPNGRNTDGSLNNIKFTKTSVLTRTLTATDYYEYALTSGGNFYQSRGFGVTQDNYLYDIASGEKVNGFKCFSANLVSGRITSFTPNTTFQAVDRNDTEWASTASKPSNRYIDLTLGASGSTYTAPANGWFSISKQGSSAEQFVFLWDIVGGLGFQSVRGNGTHCVSSLEIKKGGTIQVDYTADGGLGHFRFIYDEGVK